MGTNQAFVVDLASERVRKLAGTDNVPNTIDLTPDGRVLYVSNRGRNGASYYLPGPEWGSVLAIDTASGRCSTPWSAATRPPAWTCRPTAGCWPSPTSSTTASTSTRSRPTRRWPPAAAAAAAHRAELAKQ